MMFGGFWFIPMGICILMMLFFGLYLQQGARFSGEADYGDSLLSDRCVSAVRDLENSVPKQFVLPDRPLLNSGMEHLFYLREFSALLTYPQVSGLKST